MQGLRGGGPRTKREEAGRGDREAPTEGTGRRELDSPISAPEEGWETDRSAAQHPSIHGDPPNFGLTDEREPK